MIVVVRIASVLAFVGVDPNADVRVFFFFNDPAPTEIYPLPLPDALPISTLESVLFLLARLADQGPAIDAVVLLQPTSPLRRAEDVTQCWASFDPATSPAVVSVTATAHPGDLLLRREESGTLHWARGAVQPLLHRQAFPTDYWVNGAVYIATPAFLRDHQAFVVPGRTRGVLMPLERSLDID